MVRPQSAKDVCTIVKLVKFFQIKFSVRSGGRTVNPGWSSIGQSGILVDLQNLRQVTVSTDKTVVSLGPGARWGDVYATLDPYEVSVVGGQTPHVGVGGFILGGFASLLILGSFAANSNLFQVVSPTSQHSTVLLRIMSRVLR